MSDSPDAPSEQLRESERTPSYEGLLARLAEFEQQHAALLQAVAARRESEAEYRQLFANMQEGFAFPVEVSSSGATIDGTRTLISVVRDITERKRAEDALREANLQLAEADRSKNNFMACCRTSCAIRSRRSATASTSSTGQRRAVSRRAGHRQTSGAPVAPCR